jgi:DNA (cytosine-5)-methyltransferase 1
VRIAEIFAGIGGVTSGFIDAGGYKPVFLNDVDSTARDVFRLNFPAYKTIYHASCISNISGPWLMEEAGGEVDGLLGCPPCQGFSAVGSRKTKDPRNDLIWHMRRLIWSVRPKFFVLENVPALLNSRYYRKFADSLAERYFIESEVVNAAEFGVPQLRRRAVVIGFQKQLGVKPSIPQPRRGGCGEIFDYASGKHIKLGSRKACAALGLRMSAVDAENGLVSLAEALDDLPPALKTPSGAAKYRKDPDSAYQRRMRRLDTLSVKHHIAWSHKPELVERLSQVTPGECPRNFGRRRNEVYFSQAYGRLHPDGLARTITTNFHNPGSGRFTHYRAPRTLTVREALRLQGFRDSFRFAEDVTQSSAERLIGNAFPRPLAKALASHIKKLLT